METESEDALTSKGYNYKLKGNMHKNSAFS